jgi:two-component system, cell cycle response regulator
MSKKILIVEDDVALIKALSKKFTKEKFEVLTAANGQLGLASALKNHPKVILLDLIMPVMDGLAMLKKLRQDKWGRTVSVIVLSNLSEAEKTVEALEQGVHDYLIKTDWSLEDILKKVKEKLV